MELGYMYFIVSGSSMWPCLRSHDILCVQNTDFEPGDIIIVQKEGFTLAHRVLESFPRVLTKGDNLSFVDQEVKRSSIVGVATFAIRAANEQLFNLRLNNKFSILHFSRLELYYIEQLVKLGFSDKWARFFVKCLLKPLYLLNCKLNFA